MLHVLEPVVLYTRAKTNLPNVSTRPAMEVAMIVIALRYDALNRVFIPLGEEAVGLFEDGELYLVTISDSGQDVNVESFDLRPQNIAHA